MPAELAPVTVVDKGTTLTIAVLNRSLHISLVFEGQTTSFDAQDSTGAAGAAIKDALRIFGTGRASLPLQFVARNLTSTNGEIRLASNLTTIEVGFHLDTDEKNQRAGIHLELVALGTPFSDMGREQHVPIDLIETWIAITPDQYKLLANLILSAV